ncbi:MAG TPA: hypothetical protein VHB98_12460 [Chloroflexota bacterium]|nr:hypothetical protein [Chloroflexota bacterium]
MQDSIRNLMTLGLILGAVLTGSAPSEAAPAAARSINLTLADLPSGFAQRANIVKNAQEIANSSNGQLSLTQVTQEGILQSTEEVFTASHDPKVGLSQVYFDTILFQTAADARADLSRTIAGTHRLAASLGVKVAFLSVAGVGASQAGWRVPEKAPNKPTMIQDAVVFYRGRYEVSLSVMYNVKDTFSQALAFARIVDARIKAAG